MKEPQPDDPLELVGVALDVAPDDAALEEMACCFVEEYARMGWSGDQILRMFRSSAFRGPHRILEAKGEEFVRSLTVAVDQLRAQFKPADGSGE